MTVANGFAKYCFAECFKNFVFIFSMIEQQNGCQPMEHVEPNGNKEYIYGSKTSNEFSHGMVMVMQCVSMMGFNISIWTLPNFKDSNMYF